MFTVLDTPQPLSSNINMIFNNVLCHFDMSCLSQMNNSLQCSCNKDCVVPEITLYTTLSAFINPRPFSKL